MIQNSLFGVKPPKPKLNGMYYDPSRDMYISYVLGRLHGEWTGEKMRDEGFTKESLATVQKRILSV